MVAVGVIVSLFAWREIVQRHRHAVAIRVMDDMVAAGRVGDHSRLGLSRDDAAELEAARPWLGARFEVVCGRAPPLASTVYECHVLFANGGRIQGDADTVAGRVRWIDVAPPPARR